MQLSSAKFTVTGDWSAVFDDMYERGFTDGLPVVMSGEVVVPNVSLKGTGRAPFVVPEIAKIS